MAAPETRTHLLLYSAEVHQVISADVNRTRSQNARSICACTRCIQAIFRASLVPVPIALGKLQKVFQKWQRKCKIVFELSNKVLEI